MKEHNCTQHKKKKYKIVATTKFDQHMGVFFFHMDKYFAWGAENNRTHSYWSNYDDWPTMLRSYYSANHCNADARFRKKGDHNIKNKNSTIMRCNRVIYWSQLMWFACVPAYMCVYFCLFYFVLILWWSQKVTSLVGWTVIVDWCNWLRWTMMQTVIFFVWWLVSGSNSICNTLWWLLWM